MYPCQKCGACCRLVGRSFWGKDIADGDGVCRFLDRGTSLCRIYGERPIFCNVDEFYELYCAAHMTREEFYRQNKRECEQLRKML